MSVLRDKIKEQACLNLALSLKTVMRMMRGGVVELFDGAAGWVWVTGEATAEGEAGLKTRVVGGEGVIREY